MSTFNDLLTIVRQLRHPATGCPWDIAQTPTSLIPNMIEEIYEVVEAIENSDHTGICEELGDSLLHLVFQAQLAEEANQFTIHDVLTAICQKLITRHPHVFTNPSTNTLTPETVKQNWETIKQHEKKYTRQSVLEGIPKNMPALIQAHRVQEKAANVGFDWDTYPPTIDKIHEEIQEVKDEIHKQETHQPHKLAEEIGDLFFACVNLSRKLGIDAETALRASTQKFTQRFAKVEQLCKQQNINMHEVGIEKLDELWELAKKD